MLLVIYVHGMPEPLAREVCDLTEMKEELTHFGSQRIEKFVVTDFRPVCKDENGNKREVFPDF